MIAAVVRYKLRAYRLRRVPRALSQSRPRLPRVTGLISKHFIWIESGWAGGVYQWNCVEDAKAFYAGPWLDGIVQRYGMEPEIDFYEVFAVIDDTCGRFSCSRRAANWSAP